MFAHHGPGKCIIVLGCPRSGTSLVAGILHHLGVNMGDHLLEAKPSNPKGFFEDTELLELHEKMIGGVWHNPNCNNIQQYLPTYESLIQVRKHRALWGTKDPRLCFLLEYLLDNLDCEVKLILTERPRSESAHSMLSETFNPVSQAFFTKELWYATKVCERYDQACQKSVQKTGLPSLTVNYHDMLVNPQAEILKICEFIQYYPPIDSAVSLVDPSLRHFDVSTLVCDRNNAHS